MQLNRRDFIHAGAFAAAGFMTGCAGIDAAAAEERLGVCSWSFQKPLDQVARYMRKMHLRRVHLALQPFLEGDARHGAAESAEARVRVEKRFASGAWKLSATMLSFTYEDYSTLASIRKTGGIVPDDKWEANKILVKRAAQTTAHFGARYMTLHAGFLDESSPAAVSKYRDRVQYVADVCGEQNVKLLLESGQETAEDLAKFMPTVKNVGINFDPANMILYGKGDPVAAVPLLAPWIEHVHVKDAIASKTPGEWGTEVPWGEGEVKPRAFFDALAAAGYVGNFAIEREAGNDRPGDIELAAIRFAKRF